MRHFLSSVHAHRKSASECETCASLSFFGACSQKIRERMRALANTLHGLESPRASADRERGAVCTPLGGGGGGTGRSTHAPWLTQTENTGNTVWGAGAETSGASRGERVMGKGADPPPPVGQHSETPCCTSHVPAAWTLGRHCERKAAERAGAGGRATTAQAAAWETGGGGRGQAAVAARKQRRRREEVRADPVRRTGAKPGSANRKQRGEERAGQGPQDRRDHGNLRPCGLLKTDGGAMAASRGGESVGGGGGWQHPPPPPEKPQRMHAFHQNLGVGTGCWNSE